MSQHRYNELNANIALNDFVASIIPQLDSAPGDGFLGTDSRQD